MTICVEAGDQRWADGPMHGWELDESIPPRGKLKFYRRVDGRSFKDMPSEMQEAANKYLNKAIHGSFWGLAADKFHLKSCPVYSVYSPEVK